MEKAINSILVGGEDVEIIVVNDGSKDGTQEIAERYQEKYPTIVKRMRGRRRRNGARCRARLVAWLGCGYFHAFYVSVQRRPYRENFSLLGRGEAPFLFSALRLDRGKSRAGAGDCFSRQYVDAHRRFDFGRGRRPISVRRIWTF